MAMFKEACALERSRQGNWRNLANWQSRLDRADNPKDRNACQNRVDHFKRLVGSPKTTMRRQKIK